MKNIHDFAYSVALVRTLETLLLNTNEVERMTLAKNAEEAFKVLNESDYADNKSAIQDVSDFQKVINEGLLEIQNLLKKISPDSEVLNIILHQYDFHNIKTMLKAKLSSKPFEEIEGLLNKMGAIPIASLKKYIFENTNEPFNLKEKTENYIKEKITKIQQIFQKTKNPQTIDLYLDQKLSKIIFEIAKTNKNIFLIDYIKKLIDLNNIKLFLRMKIQNKDVELYKSAFLRNGTIPCRKFEEAFDLKIEDFPQTISATPYLSLVEKGIKHYEEEKTFIYLEREMENHLTDYIKKAKFITFGPEPLIAYFLAKKNNALIIRMIMVNKLNNIEPVEIEKRLRNLYL
jgi:V/A-type H+/Na+-transporting ATPase subunit C